MLDSIELFCGAGGLALGLQQAGFNHQALLEWDKDSCENIKSNISRGYPDIQHWNVFQTDVRLVHYNDYGVNIQLVSGGPPCQPFSLGGKHQGRNDHRDMFPEAVRAVRELRPRVFIFENVRGLLRQSFSTYFNYILLQLTYPEIIKKDGMDWLEHLHQLEKHKTSASQEGLFYNVVFRSLNAADFGVPQMRHRVVIVGFRSDLNAEWTFPDQTHSREKLLAAQLLDQSYWEKHKVAKKYRPKVSERELNRIRGLVDGQDELGRWQTVRDVFAGLPDPQDEKAAHKFKNHEYRPGAKPYPGHSGSLLDEPSKTIKAGAHGVPGGENTINMDDGTLRYYTVRESARIQTFPDNYIFTGSWTESMRQIGNAVPVALATKIGESVITQLERIDRDGTKGQTANHRAVQPTG